jgi:sugar phosphate isomerase/epimerase
MRTLMNKLINSPQNLGTTAPMDYIHATKNAGYEAIGIRLYPAPGRTYNFNPIVGNPTLMRDVTKAIPHLGLEMYDIYSYYLQPEMEWDIIMPTLDFAGELGAKYLLVIGDDGEWSRMVDNMGRICEKLQPMGIRACVEAYATALTPLATAVRFCADCKPYDVGLCMDPRQGFRDEKEESNVLLQAVDRQLLPYAQINDSTAFGNNGILPGEGDVPLFDYLDALPAGIDLSTEAQFPSDYTYTGAEWAKITVERTRKLLGRYYASRNGVAS